jgi:ATP-binding cassette subfamily B protein
VDPLDEGIRVDDAPSGTTETAPRARLGSMIAKYQNAFNVARASLFWALLRRQRRTLKWMFFFLFVSSIGFLQVANLTRGMVDNAIVNQTAPLWPYVRRLAFWALWVATFKFVQQQLAEKLSYQIEFDLRVWLYTHIQSAELRRLDHLKSGQLVTRSLTDIQLVEILLSIFPTIIGYAPLLLAIGLVVIIINPVLGILAVLALPVNLWLLSRFRGGLRALSWAELNERAEVTAAIDEPVRGIRVVKAFGREDKERRRLADVTERTFRFGMARARLLARYDVPTKMMPLLVQAALLAAGAFLLSQGELTLGTFLLAFQLGSGLSSFALAFNELASAWQYLRGAQDRLAEMLALSTRPVTDGRMVPQSSTGIELDGVAAEFDGRAVLHGLDLQVRPGELVVVTGPPGSGKSTLAGIASGLIEVDRGRATLGGVELSELDQVDLRRAVRVVSEEPLLLAASVRDNLLLGAPGHIDDDVLLRAMHTVKSEDVLDQLAGGLDGMVGDRGLTVSGGQRQRLSLARALVVAPRVLVLDDALSAVNPSLEVEIMRRVRQSLPETAILYITRRNALVAQADRTLLLDAAVESDRAEPVVAPPAAFDATFELPDDRELADATLMGMHGGDAIGALEDEERVERDVEVVEGTADPSALAGLAAIDPKLAKLVAQVEFSDERVDIPDDVTYSDTKPTFRGIARPFRRTLLITVVLVVMYAFAELSGTLIFGQVTDVIDQSNPNRGYAWAALLAGIAVAFGVIAMLFRIYAMKFTQSIGCLLRRRVFFRLTKLGVNYYDRELPGDVATRVVADLDKLLQFLQQAGFQLVSLASLLVVSIVIMCFVAPGVTLVVLGLWAVIIAATLIELPIVTRAYSWSRDELGIVTRKFQEDFGARHEIRRLGAYAIQTQKFVEASWERRRARWWAATVFNAHASFVQFMSLMTTALVLWKAGTLVWSGAMTVGAALSVQLLANAASPTLLAIGPIYNQALDVRVSWYRLGHPFDEPVLPATSVDAQPCAPITGPVEFDGVRFTYPNTTRAVLHDVSFTMEPGKVTALVGFTGAGKSSIAKLLMRTYDADAGTVTANGQDIRGYEPDSYRSRLGIVPQDPFVFKGTVASNIRYAKLDASDQEIREAARAVAALDVLSALPGGFEHPVDEEGRNLTGSQRQLIALARAWLAEPDVLVLDEATSLLDAAVEEVVIRAVHELRCTTLMITHRESVASRADNVVVLDAGRVVDAGTEEQVARPGGPYDRLWRVQEDELAEERDRELAIGAGPAATARDV